MNIGRGIIADPPSGSSVSNSHTYIIVSNRFCKGGNQKGCTITTTTAAATITATITTTAAITTEIAAAIATTAMNRREIVARQQWRVINLIQPVTMIHRFELKSAN